MSKANEQSGIQQSKTEILKTEREIGGHFIRTLGLTRFIRTREMAHGHVIEFRCLTDIRAQTRSDALTCLTDIRELHAQIPPRHCTAPWAPDFDSRPCILYAQLARIRFMPP